MFISVGGGPDIPNNLQKGETTVISNEDCMSDWGDNINDGHVCIIDEVNGDVTSCQVRIPCITFIQISPKTTRMRSVL